MTFPIKKIINTELDEMAALLYTRDMDQA